MSVHLTQLITESVKASIHVHKLCHDGLKSHFACKRRGSGGGWCGRSWRSCHLSPWLPQSKLDLTPSNSSSIYDTYNRKMRRLRIGDRKTTKKPRDNRRKNELIASYCILIDIYKGEYEVRGNNYGKPLKEGQQKRAQGSKIEL